MTYVVTEKCVDCKYTTCVSVCPVDAFHELPDRLYINPETCIDCNACMDECPVEAIYPDMDVPDELQEWIELNEKAEDYPQLVGQLDPLKGPKCVDSNADQ
jgi:ferredoxin